MLNLKQTIAAAAILLSVCTYANAGDIKTLQKQLKPWQPKEITTQKNIMTVVLPGKEITSEAYSQLIMSGVCTPIWTHDAPASYLKNIKEISVINEYKSFGYTFEDPAATCNEIAPLADKAAQNLLLSKTHTYTGK
ncbi:hypothetical protein ACV822_004511 [Klebsiella aerogenes]|uniref:hypothetical protein n=1 Tax=Klebsiella aerogenes TaxID=548 RepID=UPI0007506EDF|nr:hypothetical protein [Klebsiella aerogenes]ELA2171165.1 hypothetical protein [Klebsiella aerogenes]KUQ06039.1 hypothetical protein AWI08_16780 [Klebsiella aerogenes]MBS6146295.1 hypothetical protein [Klebsiella aerogenes]HEM8657218.1 hypothetical protein [Klebsiella aerogenes]